MEGVVVLILVILPKDDFFNSLILLFAVGGKYLSIWCHGAE